MKTKFRRGFGCLLLAGIPGSAMAGSLPNFLGIDSHYTLSLGYAAAMRTEKPADELINGPIDPLTGLPTTANGDDGNRNFSRGSLTNNRISVLGELFMSRGSYGVVVRGDAFYDDVYHRRNDNDSPATVNKSGDNDRFSSDARHYNGSRARLLDAYAYSGWALADGINLDLRLGRQVVAWGESLFFSGFAAAQGPADATKANVPGVEVKNILLPVAQVAMQLSLSDRISLLGHYKLEYKPSELDPAGSFFSTSDIVGPGGNLLLLAPGFSIARTADNEPSDHGQWGAGLNWQVSGSTSLGFYHLRYHNTNPSVSVNLDPTFTPVSYTVGYFDGIKMSGASFSTQVGGANIAGEVSVRDGVDVLVDTVAGPTSSRARVSQALLSGIYTLSPNAISQQIVLVAELGYLHVNGVDEVMDSTALSADRSSWGGQMMATFSYPNVFDKWDLAVPVSFGGIAEGNPAMAGAFGALYGEGDMRASIGTNFTYLQNLQLGVAYNAFLGSPDAAKRPYADRDYVALNFKYSF